jgi:threonylcarbamoyladenosine tRNA methylthiotransferase MtaB
MQRVAITTLGCKTNQFESAAMSESLEKAGFQLVPFEAQADVYLINTCTVTSKTDAESRRLIRRAARSNPAARVVVTGCYAQVAFDSLQDMPEVNLILGNTEKKGIVGFLRDLDAGRRVVVSDIQQEVETTGLALESFAEHTRAFLQIQNGCDAYCSYCIVPYARGRSRSVPFDEVLDGLANLAANGFREVVLSGIHLGGYGGDLHPRRSLLDVLEAAEERQLVQRLRIGSVEPLEISESMIRFLARSTVVCPHLHVPLQSGSDGVLARMNRRYTIAEFRAVLDALVAAVPDICIGADVIAGFPGETDEEFEEGYAAMESLPFAYLHVFPFSPREGTPAATMGGQVSPPLMKARAQRLRRLSDLKKKAYYGRFVGRELRVLVQGRDDDGQWRGLSRAYIPVSFSGGEWEVNREVSVMVTAVERDRVRGRAVIP